MIKPVGPDPDMPNPVNPHRITVTPAPRTSDLGWRYVGGPDAERPLTGNAISVPTMASTPERPPGYGMGGGADDNGNPVDAVHEVTDRNPVADQAAQRTAADHLSVGQFGGIFSGSTTNSAPTPQPASTVHDITYDPTATE